VLTEFEKELLIEILNHQISWRLHNRSRMNQIYDLRQIKKKIEEMPTE
jgi:hypothetical protein